MAVAGRTVGFIPGDGIGPEVAWAARRCVDATGVPIQWEEFDLGQDRFMRSGDPLPAATADDLLKLKVTLKSPLETGYGGLVRNPNVLLKELLGVFASVRRCRAGDHGLNVMIIREEGTGLREFNAADPSWPVLNGPPGGAAAIRFTDPGRARAFFEFAFIRAEQAGRKRVTVAHKASVLKKTDGLWLKAAEDVARSHPSLDFEDQLVDHVALQLARSPHRFDVVIAGEMYGDILGDLAVGLTGGLGVAPQSLHGLHGAIFTSVHGTAPKYAGLDRANPCAMILAAADLLAELGERKAAGVIEGAVREAVRRTPGEAGESGTGGFVDSLVEAIQQESLGKLGETQKTLI